MHLPCYGPQTSIGQSLIRASPLPAPLNHQSVCLWARERPSSSPTKTCSVPRSVPSRINRTSRENVVCDIVSAERATIARGTTSRPERFKPSPEDCPDPQGNYLTSDCASLSRSFASTGQNILILVIFQAEYPLNSFWTRLFRTTVFCPSEECGSGGSGWTALSQVSPERGTWYRVDRIENVFG